VAEHALVLDSAPPTARLMWEACHRNPDPQAVRDAVSHGADLAWAVRLALEQRVGPLLWRALEAAGEAEALGEHRSSLESVAEVHLMEGLLLLPRAVSVALRPLVDGGLEPVVLKGPVLATRYPAPGLRPMEDIDVLLPIEQHREAIDLLEQEGWEVVRPAGRDRYDTVLKHPEVASMALELHYGLESHYERLTSLDAAGLWSRRIPVDCLGCAAFGLPLPEEIVVLAAHAGKPFHGFSRLVWIADLAMIVGHSRESGSEVDWESVRSVAQRGGCTTVVGVALRLAGHAGVDFPSELFPLPERGWRRAALSRLIDPLWPLDPSDPATFHLRYALTDGNWRRAKLLFGSGHGMPTGERLRWSTAVPLEALSRWRELRHVR
jgi:hypothetical protein